MGAQGGRPHKEACRRHECAARAAGEDAAPLTGRSAAPLNRIGRDRSHPWCFASLQSITVLVQHFKSCRCRARVTRPCAARSPAQAPAAPPRPLPLPPRPAAAPRASAGRERPAGRASTARRACRMRPGGGRLRETERRRGGERPSERACLKEPKILPCQAGRPSLKSSRTLKNLERPGRPRVQLPQRLHLAGRQHLVPRGRQQQGGQLAQPAHALHAVPVVANQKVEGPAVLS